MTTARYKGGVFQPYTWKRNRPSGMKYKKRHRPSYVPKLRTQHRIHLDLSFRVGRMLSAEEEDLFCSFMEQAAGDAIRRVSAVDCIVLFNDGEMIHVRIKFKHSIHVLRAYIQRTFYLGEAFTKALKGFNKCVSS